MEAIAVNLAPRLGFAKALVCDINVISYLVKPSHEFLHISNHAVQWSTISPRQSARVGCRFVAMQASSYTLDSRTETADKPARRIHFTCRALPLDIVQSRLANNAQCLQ